MDDSVRRNVCRLIAGIVVSDEDLSPEEDAFIDRMLQRFGIPLSERDVIFPIVDATEAANAMRALEPAVRQEAFASLLEAAAADGSIAPEELTYLEAVSDVVGVSRDDLSDKLGEALRAAKKK
ncbi:MAG TPA: TerB family tellurite resistance protein [Polyangiaceae bacterium]|nr:TerB family tellurite resistance protein [Polyangiaceae bacterium]